METALRVVLVLAVIGLALWVPKYLHDNPVEGELSRLNEQVAVLEAANERLQTENESYRTLVRGLREDPRVLDRQAREALGMSRANELVIWFDSPRQAALSSH